MREKNVGTKNRLGNKIFPNEKDSIKLKFLLFLKLSINVIHILPWKETEKGNFL